ncbi:MAG: ADP-ribosylglycohydrolase family protein [Bacteroidota bacterium]|nr:ADP-ribosylglycohydrolase family protein [Bacteroidota bacterium]
MTQDTIAADQSAENTPETIGSSMQDPRAQRELKVVHSSLWAAYGDALGWISELTDEQGLTKRTRGASLRHPIAWQRKIGGRYGVKVNLPVGCYSDDTQLRLATSRALSRGWFDVELFSKIELPVWLSYKFGAGRATSRASGNLARRDTAWYANFFKGWRNSGGNGAAMRVQPHVWAAPDLEDPKNYLPDVIRNSVCTHSHPVGLLGAALHALTLASTLNTGRIPGPGKLLELVDYAGEVPELAQSDTQLCWTWWPEWNKGTESFGDEWERTISHCRAAIDIAAACTSQKNGEAAYLDIIDRLDLKNPKQRGSGTLCAIAAVALAWCEPDIESALTIAANALHTDTDTIATMGGAIMGAVAAKEPPVSVQDEEMLRTEARRLAAMAAGEQPVGHSYPNKHHWQAPATQSDALQQTPDGGYWIAGLGRAEPLQDPIQVSDSSFQWQWFRLEFGQTVLIKRRTELQRIDLPVDSSHSPKGAEGSDAVKSDPGPQLNAHQFDEGISIAAADGLESASRLDIDQAIAFVRKHHMDYKAVGMATCKVIRQGSTVDILSFVRGLLETLRYNAELSKAQELTGNSEVPAGEEQQKKIW